MYKNVAVITFYFISLNAFSQPENKLVRAAGVHPEGSVTIRNDGLGALVFGGMSDELLQLNESTLWSGGPVKHNVNLQSASYLPRVCEQLINRARMNML